MEWPVEARHDDAVYILRVERAASGTGWGWLVGLRNLFSAWGWFGGDDDGWDLRVRRREDDPSGALIYQEAVPRDRRTGGGTELVNVLNMLSDALGLDTYSELWHGWDS